MPRDENRTLCAPAALLPSSTVIVSAFKSVSEIIRNNPTKKYRIPRLPGASQVALVVKTCWPVQEAQVRSLGWEDPLEEGMAIHSSILAGELHGQRSLENYSPWGPKKSDTTEWLSTMSLTFTSRPLLTLVSVMPCNFYWRWVYLQCCVIFRCLKKW